MNNSIFKSKKRKTYPVTVQKSSKLDKLGDPLCFNQSSSIPWSLLLLICKNRRQKSPNLFWTDYKPKQKWTDELVGSFHWRNIRVILLTREINWIILGMVSLWSELASSRGDLVGIILGKDTFYYHMFNIWRRSGRFWLACIYINNTSILNLISNGREWKFNVQLLLIKWL